MAGAATAPRTAPRTAGGRRRASARGVAVPKRAPGRRVPVAVGRTATAVASLPDSGLVVRLTRGRLWIAALAILLVGIVGLNVLSLSLSSSTSQTARTVEELEQQGSALQAQLARELSSRQVQNAAGALGLIVPEPGAIRYLRPSAGDAEEAARRLRSGELAIAAPALSSEAGVAAPLEAAPPAPGEAAPPTSVEPAVEPPAPAPEPQPAPAPEPAPAPAQPTPDTGAGAAAGGVASP